MVMGGIGIEEDSGNSYENKHNSNLGACNHADAWVGGCIGVGYPDPPVEEDLHTRYHDHLDYYGIGKHLLHRHLKTEGDNDGDHYHDPPEQSDDDDDPFVSHQKDVVHAHNYTDFEAGISYVDDWHIHKDERLAGGDVFYDDMSHHGDNRNEQTQNGEGHDGYVDNPEPSDFDFEPGILPQMEVVTPEYPVQPDVDTVTPPEPPPPTPKPVTPAGTLDEVKDRLPHPDKQPATPDDTSMIDDPVEVVVEAEAVELIYHEWTWRKGYNLVSFPVMREDIETVADLYQEYALFNAPQDIIYVVIDGCWFAYNGQEGQIAGDVRITPYLGVLMVMDWTAILGMRGVEQIGDGELELTPGLNVVGLSELPSRYRKPSDLLEIDGIEVAMTTAWNAENKMSDIRLIGRAGDPGDNTLYRGQAVLLIATTQLTLDLSSDTLAAPMAPRVGTLNTSWGAMKR